MNPRATTGTYEQVTAKLDELVGKIEKDQWGCEKFEVVHIADDLYTLVWMPAKVAKKVRKEPSLKKMLQDASIYDMDVLVVSGGYEIQDKFGHTLHFAKTKTGIRRKLTKEIDSRKIIAAQKAIDDAVFWADLKAGKI